MAVHTKDGATLLAPRVMDFSGWRQATRNQVAVTLGGSVHTEITGPSKRDAEFTTLFLTDELALKDAFEEHCEDVGTIRLGVREGTWECEIVGLPESGRLSSSNGRTYYAVKVQVVRGTQIA